MHESGNSAAPDEPTRPSRQFRATAVNPWLTHDPAEAITVRRSQVSRVVLLAPVARHGDSKLRRLLRRVARLLA